MADGDKVKVTLRFRGREMAYQQLGAQLLKRMKENLGEVAQIESFPKMEGRQMVMMIAPNQKVRKLKMTNSNYKLTKEDFK